MEYRDLVRENAFCKINAIIRFYHFDYGAISTFFEEKRKTYFSDEEMQDIEPRLLQIIASNEQFDRYCMNRNLM